MPAGGTNSYTYNNLDTRVSKVDSGGTKSFMRDGVGVTAPVLSDSAAVYTPGVSERRAGVTTYEHSGIKNASLQTSTAQAVTASRIYDAFGNVASSTGSWSGPFGYAGQFGYQEDPDTGLKLLGHRYYDSSTGRFLSRDKAKDGRNWYVYCDGNPLGAHDATGRSKEDLEAFKLALALIYSFQFFGGGGPRPPGMPGITSNDPVEIPRVFQRPPRTPDRPKNEKKKPNEPADTSLDTERGTISFPDSITPSTGVTITLVGIGVVILDVLWIIGTRGALQPSGAGVVIVGTGPENVIC